MVQPPGEQNRISVHTLSRNAKECTHTHKNPDRQQKRPIIKIRIDNLLNNPADRETDIHTHTDGQTNRHVLIFGGGKIFI